LTWEETHPERAATASTAAIGEGLRKLDFCIVDVPVVDALFQQFAALCDVREIPDWIGPYEVLGVRRDLGRSESDHDVHTCRSAGIPANRFNSHCKLCRGRLSCGHPKNLMVWNNVGHRENVVKSARTFPLYIAGLLASLALAVPTFAMDTFADEAKAHVHCPRDVVVWLNLPTMIWHYKGQRWYANTIHGAFACEKEAGAAGARGPKNGQ
jgi:hypothetical protein